MIVEGPGIYENDIGAEVRFQFKYFIRRGRSAEGESERRQAWRYRRIYPAPGRVSGLHEYEGAVF
jgi:hypothetical protein